MSGKELRELLASKGILQKDIARQLNMTPGGFNQQLRAKDIKTGLLESICKALNVKMDFSMEVPNISKNMNSSSNLMLKNSEPRLAKYIRGVKISQ